MTGREARKRALNKPGLRVRKKSWAKGSYYYFNGDDCWIFYHPGEEWPLLDDLAFSYRDEWEIYQEPKKLVTWYRPIFFNRDVGMYEQSPYFFESKKDFLTRYKGNAEFVEEDVIDWGETQLPEVE